MQLRLKIPVARVTVTGLFGKTSLRESLDRERLLNREVDRRAALPGCSVDFHSRERYQQRDQKNETQVTIGTKQLLILAGKLIIKVPKTSKQRASILYRPGFSSGRLCHVNQSR